MAKRGAKKNKAPKTHNAIFPFRSVFVTVICLLGMGGSLLLFRYDLNASLQDMNRQPVGAALWVQGTAQRLSPRHNQWDRLGRQSPVYDGDTISTAAFSNLKISLTNGEILDLSENTTIRIMRWHEEIYFHVELLEGEMQVQSSRLDMEVAFAAPAPDSHVFSGQLGPRSSASMKVRDGFYYRLFQGSSIFFSGGESRRLTAGSGLRLGTDGAFLVDPPGMMFSPRNGVRILRGFQEAAPVRFNWKTFDARGNDGIVLELSENRNFSQPLGNWREQRSDSTGIELSEGTYYWRAYVLPSMEQMDSGQFSIVFVPPPRAISPADDSVVTVSSWRPDLHFSWSVPEEAEAVLLEVAANPEMNRPRLRQLVKRTNSGTGSFVTSEIGPGQWYWRVHPVFPGGVAEGDSSSYWRVRSMATGIIADEFPSAVNSFTLSVSTEPPARRTPAAVTPVQPGTLPRLIFPRDNYALESSRSPDLFFSWKNPHSHVSRFQIAERSDFSGSLVMDEVVYGSNFHGPFLVPGIYYWRVASVGSGGNSLPSRLEVMSTLAAPRLQSPRDNESLRIVGGVPINFTWESMGYADYYLFDMFLEGRNYPMTDIQSLQNNSVQVHFDPSTAGNFRWTVQGFIAATEHTTERGGLVAEGHFSIVPASGMAPGQQTSWNIPRIANIQTYSGEVQSPITLVSPASGLILPGIQALRSPPVARWTSTEPLRNAQLIVSHTADPASDSRAMVRGAEAGSATFPSLGEGIWYWTIRGDTADTRGVTPGYPFWINVLPIPQLPTAGIAYPEDRAVIDLAQLTRDRNITFRWNPVAGANTYIFSLYHGDNPPTLLQTSTPDNVLSYVFENLSVLQEGLHLWQVEAAYRNPAGVIEQRGRIVQHSFFIEVQHSTNLQTTTAQ